MTKINETAVNDIAENLYREIDAIIQEHRLNRKDLPHEEEYRGAQLIGTCVNSAYEANPAPSLTAVLRDVGKRLNASYVRGFSNVKLMQFAKTAHAFPPRYHHSTRAIVEPAQGALSNRGRQTSHAPHASRRRQ